MNLLNRFRSLVVGILIVTGGVLGAYIPSATAGPNGVVDYKPVSYDLDQSTCTNLGRAWAAYEDTYGCSRISCLQSAARVIGDYDTEACVSEGRSYADNLESRACATLRRVWVAEVNRCLTNINRGAASGYVNEAPQCLPSASTYVFIDANRGKDICVTAPRAVEYAQDARQQGISVSEAAFRRSRMLCDMAAGFDWRQSQCRRLEPGESKPRAAAQVFVVGDSVTWRAADEITEGRAAWQVDGDPGTSIHSINGRYQDYTALFVVPSVFVIALGTNGEQSASLRDRFKQATELVPSSSRVVFVTPFRDATTYGVDRAEEMEERGRWMKQIAANRPRTCIADWHQVAEANPTLLVDGVHQNKQGAVVFADTLARAVASCS